MESFSLSERWNGWTDLDVMVKAARAAIAAGPFDPLVCDVTIESDDDTATLHSLDALQALLEQDDDPLTLDIYIAHVVEDEANLLMTFNGRWLQINGAGTDWQRSRAAYYAAQVEIALVAGITTFKLPELPRDTVAETRRRLESQD
jgi:hypothetical protein